MKKAMIVMLMLLPGCVTLQPRPWTMAEKALAVTSTLGVVADLYTTMRVLDRPNTYELNPLLGKHPEDAKLMAYMVVSQIVLLVIVHYCPELRKSFLGGKTLFNGFSAIHNNGL